MKPALENTRIRLKKLRCLVSSCLFLAGTALANSEPVAEQAMQLLQAHCVDCHNPKKAKGDLRLDSRELMLKGSADGEVVTLGDRAQSVLYLSLLPDADPHMPPKKQLSNEEIALLGKWIDAKAPWDDTAFARHARAEITYELKPVPSDYTATHAAAFAADDKLHAFGKGAQVWVATAATNAAPLSLKLPDVVRSLAFSPDGKTLAIGSFGQVVLWDVAGQKQRHLRALDPARISALCFDESGEQLYAASGNPGAPSQIYTLSSKDLSVVHQHPAQEDEIYCLVMQPGKPRYLSAGADCTIHVWDTNTHKRVRKQEGHTDAVFALAFSPDGKWLASAGADRNIALWEADSDVQEHTVKDGADFITSLAWASDSKYVFSLNRKGDLFRATPTDKSSRALDGCDELALGLTRTAEGVSAVGVSGTLHRWKSDGKRLDPQEIPLAEAKPGSSFVHDVLPILSKAGCVTSECHARKGGQQGFELSIFSFDPRTDFFEITQDGRGRRVMPADPANSLLLLKASGQVAHEGGERFAPDSAFYKTIHDWIGEGMPYLRKDEPQLAAVVMQPDAVTAKPGQRISFSLTATYSDGSQRAVTELAQFEMSDKEHGEIAELGELVVGDLTGETMVVARFMGEVAIAPITIPPSKVLPAERYAALPKYNFIDELADQRFQELGLLPAGVIDDATFLRRSSLDVIGRLPTPDEARDFLADSHRDKRARWVDYLLTQPEYGDYWAMKWVDLVRPNPDRVGLKSVYLIDLWLREAFQKNMPYDQFVRELLAASGSTHVHGPAVMFRDRRTPAELTTMFSQIFLGMRLECARCHHHPNEKWSQRDFYQLAAFFKDLRRKGTGISPPISGSPEYIYTKAGGEVRHPVSDEVMALIPPDGEEIKVEEGADPRAALADWMVAPDNPYVAKAAVNRVWATFFGQGFTNPIDDFRASNPVTHAALLDALAADFVKQGYDMHALIRTITASRLYQSATEPNETNLRDTTHFSRSYRRRLPAEVLADMVSDVTGAPLAFGGMSKDARAMQTWNFKLKSEFLDAFGRPDESADPPCERDRETTLVQALHLMHSPGLQEMLAHKGGQVQQLAESDRSPREIVEALYLACFSRYPSLSEATRAATTFYLPETSRQQATEDILWALMNTAEFVFNH